METMDNVDETNQSKCSDYSQYETKEHLNELKNLFRKCHGDYVNATELQKNRYIRQEIESNDFEEVDELIKRKVELFENEMDSICHNRKTNRERIMFPGNEDVEVEEENVGETSNEIDDVNETDEIVDEGQLDLFYDPLEDDKTGKWMESQKFRVSQLFDGLSKELEEEVKEQLAIVGELPTDARLSCPCCTTLLCLISQEHEMYKNQFRALFVLSSCKINYDDEVQLNGLSKNELKKIQWKKQRRNSFIREENILTESNETNYFSNDKFNKTLHHLYFLLSIT
ncbi:hypothetical protein SNEBB_002309 [Seison nebaliae]|nr:hypothetical protein SNEBB_002309 [Seison nebaliae]